MEFSGENSGLEPATETASSPQTLYQLSYEAHAESLHYSHLNSHVPAQRAERCEVSQSDQRT